MPYYIDNKAGPQAKRESQDYLQENLAILAWTQQSSDIRLRPGPQPRLDSSAEKQVFRNLRQLAQGRTAIIISHRLFTVSSAECIYYMKRPMSLRTELILGG